MNAAFDGHGQPGKGFHDGRVPPAGGEDAVTPGRRRDADGWRGRAADLPPGSAPGTDLPRFPAGPSFRSPGPHWGVGVSPLSDPWYGTDPRAVREALESTANAMVNGAEWLASAAGDPEEVLDLWSTGRLAHVPAGPGWQIVRAVKPLGLDAVVRMCAANHRLGPVLLTVHGGTVEFLVSTATSRGWRLPGTTVVGEPGTLRCPHPHVVPLRAVEGRTWLVPPDGTGTLTDGDLLCEALAAARAAASVLGGTW